MLLFKIYSWLESFFHPSILLTCLCRLAPLRSFGCSGLSHRSRDPHCSLLPTSWFWESWGCFQVLCSASLLSLICLPHYLSLRCHLAPWMEVIGSQYCLYTGYWTSVYRLGWSRGDCLVCSICLASTVCAVTKTFAPGQSHADTALAHLGTCCPFPILSSTGSCSQSFWKYNRMSPPGTVL